MKYAGIPVKFTPSIPEGYVLVVGYRQSGSGTADPMEEYGSVLRPDGAIVSYVIRDGKIFTD